ncbi:TetR/AcrR family transcriptional regulator [Mycobacterium sp. Marseille-P9652]|uniref:TetR/AcrR family transcriptional regulator n=1 Tax=Mycobacterium sp. Marseille-P9652 TaxID=2654950 RepID=UPI0012E94201|nr:TetR/AcrR family transcriptional regulator [Mycobacterium sp. Marseille-P9652]
MAGRPNKAQAGSTGDSYHHGDLRRALLDTAVELARAGGPDAVVMRDVQRRVGVSNAAAYRHYSDRDALMAAVIAHALRQLAASMKTAIAATPERGPRNRRALARFRATGQAYIDFALAEPGLYRTAFAPHPAGRQPVHGPEDVAEQDHPFNILRQCVDDLVATGVLAARQREGVDEAAWAAVHGLATLFLDGPLSTLGTGEKKRISDRLLDTIERGVGSA